MADLRTHDDRGSHTVSEDGKSLLAVSELELRKTELSKRVDALEHEKSLLLEIRDSLLEEQQILKQRRTLAEKNRRQMDSRLHDKARREIELKMTLEKLKQEISILQKRCSENQAMEKELGDKIALANKGLETARGNLLVADQVLQSGKDTLARMDRKLSRRTLKHQ